MCCGDIFQLGPVRSSILFKDDPSTSLAYLGRHILGRIQYVLILTEQVRYEGATALINLCRAYRSGSFDEKHVTSLNRLIRKSEDIDIRKKAIVLVSTRIERKVYLQEYFEKVIEDTVME